MSRKCNVAVGHAAVAAGGSRFAAADQRLDLLHFGAIDLARLLVAQELFDLVFDPLDLVRGGAEEPRELEREIDEAAGVGVEDGDVAGGLIGDVDFVALDRPGGSACRPC